MTLDALTEYAATTGGPPLLTFEEAASRCAGRLRIMLEVKEPNPSPGFLKRVDAALEAHGLLSELLIIGTPAGKRHFEGRALCGIRAEPLRGYPERYKELAETRFLFDHGNVLTDEDCEYATGADMLVVPSVNRFHYKSERPKKGADRDIKRLITIGVKRFQIDSEFARCFDG
jgi:hypothetical protein